LEGGAGHDCSVGSLVKIQKESGVVKRGCFLTSRIGGQRKGEGKRGA